MEVGAGVAVTVAVDDGDVEALHPGFGFGHRADSDDMSEWREDLDEERPEFPLRFDDENLKAGIFSFIHGVIVTESHPG